MMTTQQHGIDASEVPPVLEAREISVTYRMTGGQSFKAVDNVSLTVNAGETLALVGESGCGKSSVAKAIMGLEPLSGGNIFLQGQQLTGIKRHALKQLRRRFQMIFQDPISSLNPKHTVREILNGPLAIQGVPAEEAAGRIHRALEMVGIDPAAALGRYSREFSGGQCQRISIARALILSPALLICDEPVSALDVSVRSQVLNVLNELAVRTHLSMLFISHDVSVVRNVADRVAVMYLGRVCETGPARLVLESPAHPYTAALLSAVPVPDPNFRPQRIRLVGEMPSLLSLPTGCRFQTRCPAAADRCREEEPVLAPLPDGRQVACHFPFALSPGDATRQGAIY